MKQIILFFYFFAYTLFKCLGQTDNETIKLYLSEDNIKNSNLSLDNILHKRLYLKFTQLINQTGITEVGYSTFLVTPHIDILSNTVDEAGMSKIYLTEANLTITINRVPIGTTNVGGATFHSFSKKLIGSGMTSNEAITNLIAQIKPTDKEIVNFFKEAKQKIRDYFIKNCDFVMNEAVRLDKLNLLEEAISLYLSIPIDAPCGELARDNSIGIYNKYNNLICEKQITQINTYIALSQNQNNSYKNYYDSVMIVVNKLSPTSDCYNAVHEAVIKIEDRLGEERKQEWEFWKSLVNNATELRKAELKAATQVSKNYKPVYIIK